MQLAALTKSWKQHFARFSVCSQLAKLIAQVRECKKAHIVPASLRHLYICFYLEGGIILWSILWAKTSRFAWMHVDLISIKLMRWWDAYMSCCTCAMKAAFVLFTTSFALKITQTNSACMSSPRIFMHLCFMAVLFSFVEDDRCNSIHMT